MKATINQTALLKELKKMSSVIRKNNIIPITGCVLLSFTKDELTVIGTDLESTCISTIPCQADKIFSVAVDYIDLLAICNSAFAPIEITLLAKSIQIVSGKSKISLSFFDDETNFPKIPVDDFKTVFDTNGDFFYNLSKASTCRHLEPLRVNLNAAAIDIQKDKIALVGCDGNFLFKKEIKQKNKDVSTIMIPDTFVQLCKNFQDSMIHIGEKYIKATYDNNTVISLLGIQKYADYKTIIPSEIEYNLTIDKKDLENCLHQISIASNIVTKQCNVEFTSDKIRFIANDSDMGKDAETEIELPNEVPVDSICISIKWLSHILSLIDTEQIEMSIISPTKTIYIKPVGEETELLLVQPLFNNNQK